MVERKILFIDDDESQREIMRRFIPKLGFVVKTADSAGAALDLLAAEEFPLIITDLSMPGMDGLELCRHIKQKHADVIVYALSGYIASFEAQKLEACGFDGYLNKPAGSRILRQAIEGAFDRLENR